MKLKDAGEVPTYGSEYCLLTNKRIPLAVYYLSNIHSSSQKEDEIEEYLRNRYAGESTSIRHFGDGGEDMSDEITQQPLLPDVK